MVFDTIENEYPTSVNVKWYRNDELIISRDYFPNEVNFFFEQDVIAYNKIVFTFKKMCKAFRYLRIYEIEDGITREFYNDEIKNLTVLEEVSPTTESLSMNTLDMEIITKNSVGVLFQRTLPIKLYRDESLVGSFFIESSEKENGNDYRITAVDYIGLLDGQKYMGGMFTNKNVGQLVADILQDMPYTIDSTLASRTVTGYLPILTKRESLQRIIFASGGIIDCSRTENIEIKLLNNTIKSNLDRTKVISVKEKIDSITTRIELVEHKYKRKWAEETLYDEKLKGETRVEFSSPYERLYFSDESTDSATIVESNANYAVISANGYTELMGRPYNDTTSTKSKVNPLVVGTDIAKIRSYDSTLVCNEINLLDYLKFVSKKLTVTFNMQNNEKIGDMVNVLGTNARIISLEYELNTPSIYATAEMEVYE